MLIKVFVLSICTAGFSYQAWTFLQIYLAYPTSQYTSEEYPDEIKAPAITICNNNRLSRKLLCKIYPDDCAWENTTKADVYCETHRRQCYYYAGEWIRDPNSFMSPHYNGKYRKDRGNTILNDVGSQKNDYFIELCDLGATGNPLRLIQCNITMIQAAKNGYPYKCFTMNSLMGKENEEPLKISLTRAIRMFLVMEPEDYMDDIDFVQVFVAIHDPRRFVNPMTEGVPLKGGKGYKLYITMEIKESLPPPYASKCVDYLNEWKKNGGYGPLSKKDCIDLCIIKAMTDEYGCVGQEITYPNNYTICEFADNDATPEMLRKCHSICGDACEETNYRFDSTVTEEHPLFFPSHCHPKEERCTTQYLEIKVSFKRMMVHKFQHVPRFESIELFSYIGGYLGMWLGISLASLYDFAEMIHDIFQSHRKEKRNQKTETPV